MNKKTLISLICCLSLVSGDDDYNKNRAGGSENTFGTSQAIDIRQEKTVDDIQDNTYAVIYNHLQIYENGKMLLEPKTSGQMDRNGSMHDFYADAQAKKRQQAILEQQTTQELNKKPKYLFMDGYCILQNEVKIGRIAGYADLNCDLSINSHATLKVALTPDFYSKALIATPLYVNIDGERYTITAGVVQNGIRTSINVASEVDDYLVSRIAAESAVKSASVVTQYAQQYLDDKYRQRIQTTNRYDQNGNVISDTDDTTPEPRKADYIGMALVEITGKLIESIGNAYLQTREYSFKIDGKTIMFADLQININEHNMKGVGYEPQNLIVQQPSTNFTDSDPTMGLDYVDANINILPDTGGIKTDLNYELPEYNNQIATQPNQVVTQPKSTIRQTEQSTARTIQNNQIQRQQDNINYNNQRNNTRNGNQNRAIDTRGNY